MVDGAVSLPLDPAFEHGVVVVEGAVRIEDTVVGPDPLAYLGAGRTELGLVGEPTGRAFLLGGEPFDETILMWWNFVGRTTDELTQAYQDWDQATERFSPVTSRLARMEAPRPHWQRDPR